MRYDRWVARHHWAMMQEQDKIMQHEENRTTCGHILILANDHRIILSKVELQEFEHLKNTSQVLNPTPPTTPTRPKRSVHQLYHTECTSGKNILHILPITISIQFLGHN